MNKELDLNSFEYFEDHVCDDITCYPVFVTPLDGGHLFYYSNLVNEKHLKFLATYPVYDDVTVDVIKIKDNNIEIISYKKNQGLINPSIESILYSLVLSYKLNRINKETKLINKENYLINIDEEKISLK